MWSLRTQTHFHSLSLFGALSFRHVRSARCVPKTRTHDSELRFRVVQVVNERAAKERNRSSRISRSLMREVADRVWVRFTYTGATAKNSALLRSPSRSMALAGGCWERHYAIGEIHLATTTLVADKTPSCFHAPRCANRAFGRITHIPRRNINVIFFAISAAAPATATTAEITKN